MIIFADTVQLWARVSCCKQEQNFSQPAAPSKSQNHLAPIALGTPPILCMCRASGKNLSMIKLERMSYLIYQMVVVILLQVAVSGVAKNDVVQEPLQVALQPVLSAMHQLLSQSANSVCLTKALYCNLWR